MQLYYCSVSIVTFCFPHVFNIFKLEFFFKEQSSHLPSLFNHLLISVWINGYLFYSLGCNTVLLSFILLFKLLQLWPIHFWSNALLSAAKGIVKSLVGTVIFSLYDTVELPAVRGNSCESLCGLWALERKLNKRNCSHKLWELLTNIFEAIKCILMSRSNSHHRE